MDFALAYADQTEADWEELRKSKHARRPPGGKPRREKNKALPNSASHSRKSRLLRKGGADTRLSGFRGFHLNRTRKQNVVLQMDVLMKILLKFFEAIVKCVKGRAGVMRAE